MAGIGMVWFPQAWDLYVEIELSGNWGGGGVGV